VGDVVRGPNGRQVHPEFFTHLLNETGISYRSGLTKYQVYQESVDKLVWKLVVNVLSHQDRQSLISAVQKHLGDVSVVIETVSDIPPGRSGKFQYVIGKR
jgi:hypothetical protein